MDCCHGVNPYLACSERLIQMQNYSRADYEADILALQTATSTWYLSIQNNPDAATQVGSKRAGPFEQPGSPPHSLSTKLENSSQRSLSGGNPNLPVDEFTDVAHEWLPIAQQPDCPTGMGTASASYDTHQPSLMDVQPSVFLSCCTPSPAKGSPSPTLAAHSPSFHPEATISPQPCSTSQPECVASAGSQGLPFSMAALGPSVEKFMQPSDGAFSLSPTVEAIQALTGENSPVGAGEMQPNLPLHPATVELDASRPVHRLHTFKGVISDCFLASPPDNDGMQWHIAVGATEVGSGTKQACGSAMNSCIPAFRHHITGSGCPPFMESSECSREHSAQPDGSLPVLMPILHSAFNRQGESAAVSGIVAHQELRNTSSCGAMSGMDVDEADEHDVQEAGSSPARLVTDATEDACDDIEASTLRRVCSLIPQRGAMLTPAAECLGAFMLSETPELHTYKKREPRRKLQNHSSVTFVDSPTVNVYAAGQDTAGMTVSAAPVLPPYNDSQHTKQTRMSSSYICMRSALTLHNRLSQTGAEDGRPACLKPPAAREGNDHSAGINVSGGGQDNHFARHTSPARPLDQGQDRFASQDNPVPEIHTELGSAGLQQQQLSTLASLGVPETVASLGANILGDRSNARTSSHENSTGSLTIDHVQHSEHSNSSFSLPVVPSCVIRGRNGNCRGELIASLDVICQALVDSKNLHVHTELGCKLSSPPSWMEAVTLMLCSLRRPHCADAKLSEEDICEICQQIAYIFLPIGSAITAMQMSLMSYLQSTGVVRPEASATVSKTCSIPQGTPLSQQATDAIQHSHMAAEQSSKSVAPHLTASPPGDFLTALLPQVMFDYIACLLNIGMKMDQIGHQHNIKDLKAVDILKQQVAFVLNELTDLSSTTVSAVMGLCRGLAPSNPGQLESLSSFLVASLDQMSASVSLMHGRLPLNESDEALQEIARADHTSQRARSCSTAFFHCLSVCGHVLHILERVTKDIQAWREDGGATRICASATDDSDSYDERRADASMGASVLGTLPGVLSAVPWQNIGQDWKILLETMPKVQATGCRLVMLVGSIIKSISDDAHADVCRLSTLPDSKYTQALNLRCSSPGPARLNTLASSASRALSMALPSPLRMSRSGRTISFSRTFGERKVSNGFQASGSYRRGSPMAQQESLSIVLPGGSDRCSWDGTLGSQTPPVTPPAARKDSRINSTPVWKQPSSPCHRLRIDESEREREQQDQDSPPPSPPALIGPYSCGGGGEGATLPAINTVSYTSVGMFDSVISGSPSKTPRSLTPPPGLSKLQVHRPNEICSTPYGDSASGSPQISPFVCPPGSPISVLSPAVGKHGLTFRALLDASSPTLVIEEPVLELGPLSAKDTPVSPIARPMVRRRLAMPQSSELSVAPSDQDDGDPSKLSDNPVCRHRRAVSMSLSHIQTAVPSSLCMTSSAADKHSLGKNSAGSSKHASASSSQIRQTGDAAGKLPGALTVQEVSEVQSALARGIAALGTELVGFLQVRCEALVDSIAKDERAPDHSCMEWEHRNPLPSQKERTATAGNADNVVPNRQLATILAHCEQAAPAQLSICHNLRRWTQVLCASESLDSEMCTFLSASQAPGRISAEVSGEDDNSLDTCQQMCNKLEASTEGLRSTAQAGRQCVGAAVGCDAQIEPPMELLLGSAIKPLGCKSLGSVWMHHLGAEYVAVKWVKIEDQPLNRGYTAAQKQNMVIHEVEALLRLKHPNIVQFLGVTTMHTPCAHPTTCSEEGSETNTDSSCPSSPTDASQKLAVRKGLPSIGIVLELCHYGTLQDFLNQTRALFNNSSRLCVSAQGGFEVRSGTCSSALESMCLCFINSWSQRLRMGKEVALALAACHSSGVLHRDVTSFNVMLSDMNDGSESAAEHALRWCEVGDDEDILEVWSLPWSTRLIDFGLSKNGVARGGSDTATTSIDMHSLPWMAPEIIQGSEHLQSGDVYGLGMVLWELLTTHQPPVRTLPSVIRPDREGFREKRQEAAGPCVPALREMQQLHEQGKTAELMRKLHGVPCPVLSDIFDIVRSTQCSDPSQRLSAAAVAQRLAELESRCSSLPAEVVAMDDEGLARYFRDPDAAMDEAMTPFSDLTPFSSSSTL